MRGDGLLLLLSRLLVRLDAGNFLFLLAHYAARSLVYAGKHFSLVYQVYSPCVYKQFAGLREAPLG